MVHTYMHTYANETTTGKPMNIRAKLYSVMLSKQMESKNDCMSLTMDEMGESKPILKEAKKRCTTTLPEVECILEKFNIHILRV